MLIKMAKYNKQSSYVQSESSSYTSQDDTSYGASKSTSSGSSLYVLNGQVKEKKIGICTCNKTSNCRGTCIS